jgi:hypothetical protein
VYTFGETIHFTPKQNKESISKEVSEYLSRNLDYPFEIQEIEPTIEDCFMALMNHSDGEK